MSNSLQPTLNLKCNRPSHWLINKLITADDRIGDTCCRFETITGPQFNFRGDLIMEVNTINPNKTASREQPDLN